MKFQLIKIFVFLTLAFNLMAVDIITEEQEALLQELPVDQRETIRDKMLRSNKIAEEIEDVFEEENVLVQRPDLEEECTNCIFGYEMFQFAPTTFAPSNNVPISSTYKLGPGDKVELEYYGTEQASIESFISRDGTLYLPLLGPTNIAGLSIEEAKDYLSKKVENELIGTTISFNLTELRSINVYVLGQAYKPGSYTLSALSSVINALYLSGGPNSQGSLRHIKVRRGSQEYNFDLYDLIVFGKSDTDIRLEDGDIIFIPFIENRVSLLGGGFKRPSIYEFREGESISDALSLAGGFSFEAGNNPNIELSTINLDKNQRELTRKIKASEFNILLNNGDSISVSEVQGIAPKSVKISGEVNRPGTYTLNKGDTVLEIIERAGGYTAEAFSEGIVFTRRQVADQQKASFLRAAETLEKTLIEIISNADVQFTEFSLSPINNLINKLKTEEPIGRQVVDFDLLTLKTNPISNFKLFDGDTIYVPDRPQSVNVVGEVLNSSTLQFDPNRTVEDYLNLAGGLSSAANSDSIFVIYPNGQSYPYKKRIFNNFSNLVPGSTIVVSRETRSFDAISLTKIITPIFADLATSAAAIAAISND
tara:strand:- start:370 stop:2148 length:1779 start_codon:yes stop_codon:yes gene_type:complete